MNLEMVTIGYAEVYLGRPAKGFDSPPYWAVEERAKADRLNIWSSGDDCVSPMKWRRKNK